MEAGLPSQDDWRSHLFIAACTRGRCGTFQECPSPSSVRRGTMPASRHSCAASS